MLDVDSRVWDPLFAKALDGNSIERDCHGALFCTPSPHWFAVLEVGDILDAPFQLAKFIESFFEVFHGVLNHLVEKAAALQAVTKELAGYWSSEAATMPVSMVRSGRHVAIVFLAG